VDSKQRRCSQIVDSTDMKTQPKYSDLNLIHKLRLTFRIPDKLLQLQVELQYAQQSSKRGMDWVTWYRAQYCMAQQSRKFNTPSWVKITNLHRGTHLANESLVSSSFAQSS
jgi:hypothetical protein